MKLNQNAEKKQKAPEELKPKRLRLLRKRILNNQPWRQWTSQFDGQSNINTNQFGCSSNNEQIKKDNNLTGLVEDSSELYYSILVDPGY